MKIDLETKFNLGDKVWYELINENGKSAFCSGVVTAISIEFRKDWQEVAYELDKNDSDLDRFYDEDLFCSRSELVASK